MSLKPLAVSDVEGARKNICSQIANKCFPEKVQTKTRTSAILFFGQMGLKLNYLDPTVDMNRLNK